jgi:exosortase E/protease (VPEID-CTERM system)
MTTAISTFVARISTHRIGLPARLAFLCALFFAEKIFLNEFVDFDRADAAGGLGAILRVAQHLGFRWLVAFAAAMALFSYVRGDAHLKVVAASVRSAPMRTSWMLIHVVLFLILTCLSYLLYRPTPIELSFSAIAVSWILVAGAAVVAALLAMATAQDWLAVAHSLGMIWCYAAIAASLGTGAMGFVQTLWTPTAALTYDLVRGLLTPIVPTLIADPSSFVLRTDHFGVEVADQCSGLEGLGLTLAFSIAWLICFRREYIFPRALLLIPVGLITIYLLNVLRIAALLLIGNAGYPNVAVYGFHSQAGWIAFNATAAGLVYFSRRSAWLNRVAAEPAPAADNPTAAYLMPLLAILAAGMVSHAISGNFETFYPLRLVAGAIFLAMYARQLGTLDWHWSWRGPAVGMVVFAIWMVAAWLLTPTAPFPDKLAALPPAARDTWIACRVAASVVTVPLAEELAYRGYLMRRLSNRDFESIPFRAVRWPALCVTAIAFGMAHGALWLPGITAGLAFGLLTIRTGRIGEAVAAHATANASIAAAVLLGHQWRLW